MQRISLISSGVLLLFLGAIVPASAKQDQREQDSQPQKQEQTKQQQPRPAEQKPARPEVQQQKSPVQAKPARQAPSQQPKAQPEQAKSNSKEQQRQAQSAKPEQTNTQQERSDQQRRQSPSSRPPQRTEEAQTRQRSEPSLRLSAMSKSRIPDARFRSDFGRTHEFRIGEPRMVGGYSRFQYGGYWFGFVQPWPVDWYYTDNVYVDYIGGRYYLCNPYYPGVHIAITVVM
jgi:hypothetical protein